MTTTPTLWKSSFTANLGSTAGGQSVPQSIGLANGNILVVWQDDSDNNAPSPYIDVAGRVFDAEGIPVGPVFQVNALVTASDETGPKIVALPDGGYVVAYGSYSDADGGFITVQRFDSNSSAVSTRVILSDQGDLTKWEITADSVGNYTVVFERRVAPGDIDVHAIAYNYATNLPGPERHNTGSNSDDNDLLSDVASFANGDIVTLTQGIDAPFYAAGTATTVEFTITNPVTGSLIRQLHVDGEVYEPFLSNEQAIPKDVAVLSGGQFVMLYAKSFDVSNFDLYMKIGSGEMGSITVVPIPVAAGVTVGHVVALNDGGFFVAWTKNGVLQGERFSAGGTPIGGVAEFASDVAVPAFAKTHLSLTADGRILVSYQNTSQEISEVIIDPRDNVIHGTAAGEVLTTQIGSTSIFGEGGDDTLLGQAGNDRFDGGPGADWLRGSAGNDTYVLQDIHRPDPNRPLFFVYDDVVEAPGGGSDTVAVQRVGVKGNYTLPANVENGIVTGADAFSLTGNELNNQLTGNSADNVLLGQAGNDRFDGGPGADLLGGGTGDDTYVLKDIHRPDPNRPLFFVYDDVVEAPGEGSDTVVVQRVGVKGNYTLPANVENGIVTGADAFSLTGNELNNQLTGRTGIDILDGATGADTMRGGAGNDRLIGGLGRDILYGGPDLDRFDVNSIEETKPGALRDAIADFSQTQQDRIDLSTIDANAGAAGNQAFVFIGADTFAHYHSLHTNVIGMVRFAGGIVQGNVNANLATDFEIGVQHVASLAAVDFYL